MQRRLKSTRDVFGVGLGGSLDSANSSLLVLESLQSEGNIVLDRQVDLND